MLPDDETKNQKPATLTGSNKKRVEGQKLIGVSSPCTKEDLPLRSIDLNLLWGAAIMRACNSVFTGV